MANEIGQVVQCVLTTSEGNASLQPMADGHVACYANAGVKPPSVMYTDRDCCSSRPGAKGRFSVLFGAWPDLEVRLDIWHFMRRFGKCMVSSSHPLAGPFLQRLSTALLVWDADDLAALRRATHEELVQAGIPPAKLTEATVSSAVHREQLLRHCRRQTRGVAESTRLVQELLEAFEDATDAQGLPLLSPEVWVTWEEERRHIACLRDPPGVQLYAITHWTTKGGQQLPVYRCARGTTGLESVHAHLVRFVPGTSANAVHYQAYLLEGLARWNSDRASATRLETEAQQQPQQRCYDERIMYRCNELASSLQMPAVFPNYTPPAEYTGETIRLLHIRNV